MARTSRPIRPLGSCRSRVPRDRHGEDDDGRSLSSPTYQAVYNGTKAFIDSFSFALRAELKDTGVTVTCLMPGATETEFFERADMLDTKVGQGERTIRRMWQRPASTR
jgi:short-subunit dehydrogenase